MDTNPWRCNVAARVSFIYKIFKEVMMESDKGKAVGGERNFPEISQKYVKFKILVAYLESCKKNGGWCRVPLNDLLKKFQSEEQLKLIDKKTISSLFRVSILSLRQGGRFDFDEEKLWITRKGKDYFNENYSKKQQKTIKL